MPTKTRIGVGSLTLPESDKSAVRKILDSNRISPGPAVKLFEEKFAKFHESKHGLLVNSGTDALRIALATLKEVHGWKDGDRVIVPSITFVATVNTVIQNNLTPEFFDVGMYDYNLNPWMLEHHLRNTTQRYRAIVVAHLFGQPADMTHIMDLAKRYKMKVVEDSCETMGVRHNGKMVGSMGDIGCFSTYVAHLIATGVGGIAITKNDRYAEVMRSYANHGRDPIYIPGYNAPLLTKELISKRFKFDRIGYSSRLTELEATLGLKQLERLPQTIKKRQLVASWLKEALGYHYDLVLPTISYGNEHAFMMFPIVIRETSKIKKTDLCFFLETNGIETRDMMPIIGQPCYENLKIDPYGYTVAKWINRCGFYIGCHQDMTQGDVIRISKAFDKFFDEAP
jgi:dTDP-4-amino-4,6-dideoxygalactose transaminase